MYVGFFFFLLLSVTLALACKKEELHPEGNRVKGLKRVWALDDGEKIKRDDIGNPLASDVNNSVWKDNEIRVFGGRNEIIAFQLIIEAKKDGADKVYVVISDLKNGTEIKENADDEERC